MEGCSQEGGRLEEVWTAGGLRLEDWRAGEVEGWRAGGLEGEWCSGQGFVLRLVSSVSMPRSADRGRSREDRVERSVSIGSGLAMHDSGLLMLQLKRSGALACAHVKDSAPISWQPGERLAIPFLCHSAGVRTRFEHFRVAYVVCHVGEHTHTGHYQTVVCVPKAEGRGGEVTSTSWSNFVLNDNSKPCRATARDTAMLEGNCYLIGLVFDPGQ